MDYLAHFTTKEKNNYTGSFTILVSATSEEDAITRLQDKIIEEKEGKGTFSRIERIFLENLYHIDHEDKKEPVLTIYESRDSNGKPDMIVTENNWFESQLKKFPNQEQPIFIDFE